MQPRRGTESKSLLGGIDDGEEEHFESMKPLIPVWGGPPADTSGSAVAAPLIAAMGASPRPFARLDPTPPLSPFSETSHSSGGPVLQIDSDRPAASAAASGSGAPPPGLVLAPDATSDEVRKLLSQKFTQRDELEAYLNARTPQLEEFSILFYAMALTGILQTGEGHFRSRFPWAVGYVLISLLPFLPGLFLPQCPPKCGEAGCSGCVTTFSTGRFLCDILFSVVVLMQGMDLARTLSDVFAASCLKREILAFAKQCCVLLLAVFSGLWVVLPSLDVMTAILRVSYPMTGGDIATRCLWVVVGVPRALFMTAVMGSFLVILKLHAYDLKAVRAAARLASSEALSDPERQIPYFAGLLNAYQHNNGLLNQSSVRLQKMVCFLLLNGTNNIFSMGTWYYSESATMRDQMLSDQQRQYDILEEILHDGSFVLMALIALGSAAHITALCDSTVRAVQTGYSSHMTAWLGIASSAAAMRAGGLGAAGAAGASATGGAAGGRRTRALLSQDVSQEAMMLLDFIGNCAERGGFRIVGQRVTFGWFVFMLSLSLAVANFGLSTVKSQGT